ncbi:MAG: ShlB/FhaC/HecB family hemolysin secretion/activation protein [Pleurocapsa sp.]
MSVKSQLVERPTCWIVRQARTSRQVMSYCCSILAGIQFNNLSAAAQAIAPLTPDPPEPVKPEPLPSQPTPLNPQLIAPPVPESVLDIPGTITVKEFQFVGNTAFSQAELNKAIAEFTGKPISFAQLIQAADVITQFYINQGYITSGAYLPAQNLRSDTVKIQVVEGSLTNIEVNVIEGKLKPSYIRSRLEKATTKPLNIDRLTEALQLLQLNPLIDSLNAELSAGIHPGTNSLSVSVVEADTFKVTAQVNNNRNPSIGTFERGAKISNANLLGIGDKITIAYNDTDGSDRTSGSYTLPINARNGTLGFNWSIANNKIIEAPFEDLDIQVDSRDFNLTWRQPIWQKATSEINQELAFDLTASRRESNASILDVDFPISPGADENGETRTSAIRFAQEWLERSRTHVFSVRSQFNLGIDAFNATVTDEEPDSQFFNWRGQFLYLNILGSGERLFTVSPSILLRSDLQLSTDALIAVEQFSLGGYSTVRGYRQDTLLTDNGWFLSAEMRLPLATFPSIQGTLQLTPFLDLGIGWNRDGEPPDGNTLLGTGLGLLWESSDRLSARIDWGIPLINSNADKATWQENGVYLQLEYDLF